VGKSTGVLLLDKSARKVILLEARGGPPAEVMLVLPTIVGAGRPFAMGVSLLDKDRLPVCSGTESFVVLLDEQRIEIQPFAAREPAVCKIDGLILNGTGLVRASAVYEGQEFFSNPAMVTDEDRPRILWGDPHVHTSLSDCHALRCRTRNLAYAAARHAYHLDFIAVADHITGGCRGTIGKWHDNLAACELFDDPGCFSALYCYEASFPSMYGGDNNVYMRGRTEPYLDPGEEGLNIAQFCERMKGDFFVVPHHTTRKAKHGEIPAEIYPGPEAMPLIEIHSKWGTSEYRGNPNPLHEVHDGPCYAQDLLAQGYHLGFIAGTDTHTSLTFCRNLEPGHINRAAGLTAVAASENKRELIYDAMKRHRCYAASGERIFLDANVDTRDDGAAWVEVICAAKSDLIAVDIVRDGRDVHSVKPDNWQVEFEWTDRPEAPAAYYYVRATTRTGAQAWSSPVRPEKKTG